MNTTCRVLVGLLGLMWVAAEATAETRKYTLRYKFHPGETLRWDVVHRCRVRTTVGKTTKTVESTSRSVKLWRVTEVKPDGSATFRHLVESVDMRQKLTGRREVRYNSRTDNRPPPEFEDLAQSVGVPLSIVTMDCHGKLIERQRKKVKASVQSEGHMTIPLPDQPVPTGHNWSFTRDVEVPLRAGGIKKIKLRQKFTLAGVKTGVATIRVANVILTPIDDPAIKSQVIQHESAGTVRFDVDAGRLLSQQVDLDKQVVGFSGKASSIHYVTRFTEKFLPAAAGIAGRTADKHQ